MHAELREALQRKIEDLNWGGPTMAPVLEALGRHGSEELLATYNALLLNSGGARQALAREAFDGERLVGCAAGTFGAAVLAMRKMAERPPPGPLLGKEGGLWAARLGKEGGQGTDAAAVATVLRESRDVWRVALGYGTAPLDEWALHAFTAAQCASIESLLWMAVLFARVGFIAPETAMPVYDSVAGGWLRGKQAPSLLAVDWDAYWHQPLASVRSALNLPEVPPVRSAPPAQAFARLGEVGHLPAGLPELFWHFVGGGGDPATITPTIAAFAGTYDDALKDAAARAILLHEGQDIVAQQPWWPRIPIDSLAAHPKGTLGYDFYHLIVDNGYDPEVFNPDVLTGFHPGIDGTNRRILQTHEIWHLVAGYSTSPVHETAISAFQLAQFGHNYSAIFLASVTTLLILTTPAFADPALQVMAEGWQHGRNSPPLMVIDWRKEWNERVEDIRAQHGIAAFQSAVPDLMAA